MRQLLINIVVRIHLIELDELQANGEKKEKKEKASNCDTDSARELFVGLPDAR